jgi:hypothetical protein
MDKARVPMNDTRASQMSRAACADQVTPAMGVLPEARRGAVRSGYRYRNAQRRPAQ